jgi:hypothetical protein
MRLSRNLAYMIAQHTPRFDKVDCTVKKFETAGEASFEHHWNNHEHYHNHLYKVFIVEYIKMKSISNRSVYTVRVCISTSAPVHSYSFA